MKNSISSINPLQITSIAYVVDPPEKPVSQQGSHVHRLSLLKKALIKALKRQILSIDQGLGLGLGLRLPDVSVNSVINYNAQP